MKKFLTALLWDDCLVLRNHHGLPTSTLGSDLDLLVRPGKLANEIDRIERLVLDCGGAIIGIAKSESFAKITCVGPASSGDGWWGICIDLFDGLRYRGAEIMDRDYLFENSFLHNGVSVLNHDLSGVLGVLKELLNNGRISSKYIVDAETAFRVLANEPVPALAPMGHKSLPLFRSLCSRVADKSETKRAVNELRWAIALHAFRTSPVDFFCRKLSFYTSRVRRFFFPPGVMIAFLGTDGAGKSTIIDEVSPVLFEATHAAISIRHLRPTLLPPLGKLRKGNAGEVNQIVTDPHRSEPSGVVGSLARLIWLWMDYVVGYWVIVRPTISKSPTVFIFDRYADDVLLDPTRFRIGRILPLTRILSKFVPRPDLIIALHADPCAIHLRKPELPLEEVEHQVRSLRKLVGATPAAVLVDTNGSIASTKEAVMLRLVEALRARRS